MLVEAPEHLRAIDAFSSAAQRVPEILMAGKVVPVAQSRSTYTGTFCVFIPG